ncbi:MAG: HlyD family efflux transporter periplasmic adaptor subunit [Bacteroidia bacterium]|nr:HlyD family efflux transporter periplasmic adaptor subunit [Bacteroidia bacterium]MDW8300957.1 HlyD family efflux transporter periplasmic adaptor subunit [Bacteroidia bacterium]
MGLGGTHLNEYKTPSLEQLSDIRPHVVLARIIQIFLVILIGFMFLPWTQNVQGVGTVTTLRPNDRPQSIPSIITGRIEEWYVREGDFVKKGDTIVRISEAKEDYFDPNLIENTNKQIIAKEEAIKAYMEKVNALEMQLKALREGLQAKLSQAYNKLEQAKLKLVIDSNEYVNAKVNLDISNAQAKRFEELYKDGLKSLTELEGRRLKQQEALNKYNASLNKLNITQQEINNAKLEIANITAEYNDKIAKTEAEQFSTLSAAYDARATVAKLRSQLNTYTKRQSYYYITAPQDCYIVQAIKLGIGEIVKDGTPLVTIVPANYQVASTIYISPRDYPVVHIGDEVRMQFDGYPSLVFGGWPNASIGTFKGKVVAIDKNISENNKYRVLVAPAEGEKWPDKLAINSGSTGIILLKDVPLGYEIWRQLNGFPPQYYEEVNTPDKKYKKNDKSDKK